MRTTLVLAAVTCFVGIGLLDVIGGNYRVGVASVLLAAVNGLLLS